MPLSGFHPAIARWFSSRFDEPTAPQVKGWPAIRSGQHTLIAATNRLVYRDGVPVAARIGKVSTSLLPSQPLVGPEVQEALRS